MAWNGFLAIIPVVFDFVKGLNLPPRTTAIATTGIIISIAYSYKYFRPNPLRLKKDENVENVLDDTPDTPVALLPDENDIKDDFTELNSSNYGLQQNVSNAEHVIGTINNKGDSQNISIEFMDNKINNPVEEDVPRSTMSRISGWDIIPASLGKLKDLNLPPELIFTLLLTIIVCIAVTAIIYIIKKKDDPKCTIGAKIKQDKQTKTKVDKVTVNQTGENSNNGSTIGLHADVTDDAELVVNNVSVNA